MVMIAEIHKIDLEDIFSEFKNPNGKILDLWVKLHFAEEIFFQGITDFTEANF